ncbi:MAG: hypothetical protein AAFY22_09195 [Pseudomonadota bacterium]
MALAGRQFHAWWEGYEFDAAAERARLARSFGFSASGRDAGYVAEDEIAQAIWGAGRLEPGDALWTMRFARTLGADARARVVVLGAGAGGPLRDLETATRWKISGLSRYAGKARGVDLKHYDQVMTRINRARAEAGLCFFELHRDPDPRSFAAFAAELVAAGGPFTFVDFTLARKNARLKSCFAAPWQGTPRPVADMEKALDSGGFRVVETTDETRSFLPYIMAGWSHWRAAFDEARSMQDARARLEHLTALNRYAHLWAERLDAIRAGQLRVVRFQTRRKDS